MTKENRYLKGYVLTILFYLLKFFSIKQELDVSLVLCCLWNVRSSGCCFSWLIRSHCLWKFTLNDVKSFKELDNFHSKQIMHFNFFFFSYQIYSKATDITELSKFSDVAHPHQKRLKMKIYFIDEYIDTYFCYIISQSWIPIHQLNLERMTNFVGYRG